MPATYEPIASQTLGADASTVSFTSIPGTYTDLVLVGSNVVNSYTGTGGVQQIGLRFNTDSGSNYSNTSLFGDGTSASSGRTSSSSGIFTSVARASDSASLHVWQIMSYSNTNVFTTVLEASIIPGVNVGRRVGLWRDTTAVTSISINNVSPYVWKAGCVFSLYGIKAA